LAQQQVETAWAKLEAFEAQLPRPEWLRTSHRWVLGACWPLAKFWGSLIMFDLFWDFDRLSKVELKSKQRSWDLGPLLGIFGLWAYVTGMEMSAHGFTHV
jgi:hypothetical protein